MTNRSESFLPVAPRSGPNRNVEVKARLADLDEARRIAQRVATENLGVQDQVDTYFVCQQGRLKLRVINGEVGQLIWYRRPDELEAKVSNYCIVPVEDHQAVAKSLEAMLGVRKIVEKTRELFLVDNVRIHLDEVKQLGAFFELEAVLSEEDDEQSGHEQVKSLCGEFGISANELLPGSYSDMLD